MKNNNGDHANGNDAKYNQTKDKLINNRLTKNKLTRRGFLDRIFLSAAGGAALMLAGTREAQAKVSKVAAKYRGSPVKGRKCGGCGHYQGNGKCSLVSGSVSSNGYCRYYSRKKSGYGY